MLKIIFTLICVVGFAGAAVAQKTLTDKEQIKLDGMIVQHRNIRSQLASDDQQLLGKLTAAIQKELFKDLPKAKLLQSTTSMVRSRISSLSDDEATTVAEYVLGGIASSDPRPDVSAGGGNQLYDRTKHMQETQMSFNLQYLQLQSQKQSEDRSRTAIINIMKAKHDTVKNSISNIR